MLAFYLTLHAVVTLTMSAILHLTPHLSKHHPLFALKKEAALEAASPRVGPVSARP